ncbi:hypothetical protein HU200_003274 [Digitaria exilis]|uniref:Bet v I/Major latex protein domain-containing protein n=1 Tax=Digitaria exilis TaxID=1010633 RepID=A0A835FV56_9POAL|nr:hypothetical protein HU200_003274 [Digitaria exilis]
MVAGVITDECTVAVSTERLWKACFGDAMPAILPKACAGIIDAVEVDGPGGAGTVLEGGKVTKQLKSQVNEIRVEAAGEGVSVVKVKVEYETLGDAPLPAEDQARLTKAYLGLVKKVEAYLAVHPDELA